MSIRTLVLLGTAGASLAACGQPSSNATPAATTEALPAETATPPADPSTMQQRDNAAPPMETDEAGPQRSIDT